MGSWINSGSGYSKSSESPTVLTIPRQGVPPSFQLEFVHCFRLESRRKHTVSLHRAYSGNELKVTREGESIKPSDCSNFCELLRGSCCKVPNAQHDRLMLPNEIEEKNGGQ